MRLAWYAGASTALAAGVVVSAFHQRANFFSAMVYLFQSNLCLMILVNLTLLLYSSFVYGLQRVCFGQLRTVEVEQLYEKAWFTVTETCLAMTIFRDEVGGFFIVMFVALLTGKVWGWIGEGRIEILEQQPPANPRLFHTRLSVSLFLSLAYDMALLRYAVKTVIQQARPDMMVMFLFEFAILLVTSTHTALRYVIILMDTRIIKKQTRERLEERRRQVREERQEILRRRANDEQDDGEPFPDEDDVDEMDIEVPGWEAKGQYVLGLDLWTDFVKLGIYTTFFIVLLSFYGLPLHIIRDLFMTVRSFIKRLGALMKYRQAVRDMNKYADATEEDLLRENTCIICREEMHPWDANDPASVERTRPKKLPCGHILHLGCLKSWMERQQVCPTCRRSVVLANGAVAPRNDAVVLRMGLNFGGGGGGGGGNGPQNQAFPAVNGADGAGDRQEGGGGGGAAAGNVNQQPGGGINGARGGVRMFNIGPFRLGFAQGGAQDFQEMAQRLGLPMAVAGGGFGVDGNAAAPNGAPAGAIPAAGAAPAAARDAQDNQPLTGPSTTQGMPSATLLSSSINSPEAILADLQTIQRRIQEGILSLQIANSEVQALRLMALELQNVREAINDNSNLFATRANAPSAETPVPDVSGADVPGQQFDGSPDARVPTQLQQAMQQTAEVDQTERTAPTDEELAQPASDGPTLTVPSAAVPAPLEASHLAANDQQWRAPGQTLDSNPPPRPTFSFPSMAPQAGVGLFAQRGSSHSSHPAAVHLATSTNVPSIPAGSPDLPAGVQIPAGWTLVPLQRVDASILSSTTVTAASTTRQPLNASASGVVQTAGHHANGGPRTSLATDVAASSCEGGGPPRREESLFSEASLSRDPAPLEEGDAAQVPRQDVENDG